MPPGRLDAVELIVASGGLSVPVHMPHAGIKFPEFTKEVKAIDNGIDQELTALRTALQNVHHDIALVHQKRVSTKVTQRGNLIVSVW